MKIFPFAGFIPDKTKVKFDSEFYKKMRDDFSSVFGQGLFIRYDENPALYILRVKSKGFDSIGLVALTALDDYRNKKIVRIEQTIKQKEILHKALNFVRTAMIKPVSILINKNITLNTILVNWVTSHKPILKIHYPDKKTTHQIWIIRNLNTMVNIIELFKKINHALIADGHHRFASMAHRKPGYAHDSILTVYFTPDHIRIGSFYRIIQKRKNQSDEVIIERLKSITHDWKEVKKIKNHTHVHLIHQRRFYQFKLTSPSGELLNHTFTREIVQNIFDISDETKSKRVLYQETLEGKTNLHDLQTQYAQDYIFLLPPLKTSRVLGIDKILPPKSTLFSPRIMNGLIVMK